jgi:hypothetical protein
VCLPMFCCRVLWPNSYGGIFVKSQDGTHLHLLLSYISSVRVVRAMKQHGMILHFMCGFSGEIAEVSLR